MKPLTLEGQVLEFKTGPNLPEASFERLTIAPLNHPSLAFRERVANTVKAARALKNLEAQRASDRAAAERLDLQRKATEALLSLLSDDVLNTIIGQHAGWGELQSGTIKVTKHGVELHRSGSTGASQMSGEKLDVNFHGPILQSGQQLTSFEFQNRSEELRDQGIEIVGVYDASGASILITFDYAGALG